MNLSQQGDPTECAAGIYVVILLHIVLIYVLARKVVEVVKAPLHHSRGDVHAPSRDEVARLVRGGPYTAKWI